MKRFIITSIIFLAIGSVVLVALDGKAARFVRNTFLNSSAVVKPPRVDTTTPPELQTLPANTPLQKPPNGFKIIFHIGTQIEDIADAQRNDPTIALLKNIVDGYYFLVLRGGPLIYWPERPLHCSINLTHLEGSVNIDGKNYAADSAQECQQLQYDYYKKEMAKTSSVLATETSIKAFAPMLHDAALLRAFTNFDIKNEQSKGKLLLSEMIFVNTNFEYSLTDDTLKLKYNTTTKKYSLPSSLDFLLNTAKVSPDGVMAYEEPNLQNTNTQNALVNIPTVPFGKKILHLPNNIRIVDLLGKAFEDAHYTSPKFLLDVRAWTTAAETLTKQAEKSPYFSNILFEGSALSFEKITAKDPEPIIDKNARGAAWLLKNSSRNITFLIPSYWQKEDMVSEEARDKGLIKSIESYVLGLDTRLNTILNAPAGTHSICNPRIYFVVASYGQPIHAKTLPPNRYDTDGKFLRRAGTTSGEIFHLNELRQNLCAAN